MAEGNLTFFCCVWWRFKTTKDHFIFFVFLESLFSAAIREVYMRNWSEKNTCHPVIKIDLLIHISLLLFSDLFVWATKKTVDLEVDADDRFDSTYKRESLFFREKNFHPFLIFHITNKSRKIHTKSPTVIIWCDDHNFPRIFHGESSFGSLDGGDPRLNVSTGMFRREDLGLFRPKDISEAAQPQLKKTEWNRINLWGSAQNHHKFMNRGKAKIH